MTTNKSVQVMGDYQTMSDHHQPNPDSSHELTWPPYDTVHVPVIEPPLTEPELVRAQLARLSAEIADLRRHQQHLDLIVHRYINQSEGDL